MRYFVTILIGVGLVILVIILLIRAIFGGGGGEQTQQTALIDYANSNVVMRATIDGPVNAQQEHEQIRFEISQYSNDIRIISGYEGRVTRSESFMSNSSAYAEFLRALDLLGYTRGDDREEVADERGVCPFGRRYIFEIIDGGETTQRFWSTSCEDEGSFQGQTKSVIRLFEAQIPDYSEITEDVSFRR